MCIEVCNHERHIDYDPYGTCYENRQCRLKGLKGSCCPTRDGTYLACCDKVDFDYDSYDSYDDHDDDHRYYGKDDDHDDDHRYSVKDDDHDDGHRYSRIDEAKCENNWKCDRLGLKVRVDRFLRCVLCLCVLLTLCYHFVARFLGILLSNGTGSVSRLLSGGRAVSAGY